MSESMTVVPSDPMTVVPIWGIDRLLRSRGENPGNSAGPRTEAI